MSRSVLADGVAHHVWATLRLLDTCEGLDADALVADTPGTFGSIIDTLRHLVGADRYYLWVLNDGQTPLVDEESLAVPELRTVMEDNGRAWEALIASPLDPDSVVTRRRDDGSESRAPLGVRLAQALHHGTDHRSQVCTVLTSIGVEPPAVDVWDYAEAHGTLVEVPPPA